MTAELIKKFNVCALVRASGMNLQEMLDELKSANAVLPRPLDEVYFRILTRGKENIAAPSEDIREFIKGSRGGEWNDYATYGSYTNMGVEIAKGKPPVLTRRSKLLTILSAGLNEEQMQTLGFMWNWREGYYSDADLHGFSLRCLHNEDSKRDPHSTKEYFELPESKSFWITSLKNRAVFDFLMESSLDRKYVKKYFEFCKNEPLSFHIPYDAYENLEEGQTRLGLLYFHVPHGDNLDNFGNGKDEGVAGFGINFFDSRDRSIRHWTRGISDLRTDQDKELIDGLPRIEGKEDRRAIYGNNGP